MCTGQGCISVDGRLSGPHEATISALDAGLLVGDGLFESLRATGTHPYLLDRHIARLQAAAMDLGYAGVPTREQLEEEVRRVLGKASLRDAYVRITLTRGRTDTALAPAPGPATVVVAALPAPPRPAGEGIAAMLIGPPIEEGPKAKTTSRQHALRARAHVLAGGADEGIHISRDGYLVEGVSSNVFIVLGVVLLTPPADECLPGITRGRLIELAAEAGIEFTEQPIERQCLMQAREVIVTNAVQGPRPVRTLEGKPLDGWRRETGGEVFAKLLALYDADRQQVR